MWAPKYQQYHFVIKKVRASFLRAIGLQDISQYP